MNLLTLTRLLLIGTLATLLSSLSACKPAAGTGGESPPPANTSVIATGITLPVIGPAPAWALTTLDGKPLGSEQLKGKIMVAVFWATWCGPCVHEIPGYIEMQKKYADRGLVIAGLSVDSQGAETVSKFYKAKGMNYPVALATPEVIAAFGGIQAIPTTFLIDREGRIRHQKQGAMDSAEYEKLVLSLF